MRIPRAILILLLLVIIGISAFFVLRARGSSGQTGPPFALCPGPDQYGYRCQPGATFTYINATTDTRLYADDGTILIDLPFPFTFYGRIYQQIVISSNGTLQFTTQNRAFANECLNNGPVPAMGEMIAPYWDDLDLTFSGFLETAVTGEAGSRIFIIEWEEVPGFENPEDTVTFEVQLHEGTNDIVFLYQDVSRTMGSNGRTATIGLQSQLSDNTLQHGCNQLVLSSGQNIHFPHPTQPNQEFIQPPQPLTDQNTEPFNPKGDLSLLLDRLDQAGLNALQGMSAYWLAQNPQKELISFQADLNDDAQDELIILLRPPITFARYTQIIVLEQQDSENNRDWQVIYIDFPLARTKEGQSQNNPVLISPFYSLDTPDEILKLLPSFTD